MGVIPNRPFNPLVIEELRSILYKVDEPKNHNQNITISVACFILCDKSDQKVSHYNDVIMSAMASQITSLTIVYSTNYSGADKKHQKYQSSASLAFVRRIHMWPVNSPHNWPATRKMFLLMTSSRQTTTAAELRGVQYSDQIKSSKSKSKQN